MVVGVFFVDMGVFIFLEFRSSGVQEFRRMLDTQMYSIFYLQNSLIKLLPSHLERGLGVRPLQSFNSLIKLLPSHYGEGLGVRLRFNPS